MVGLRRRRFIQLLVSLVFACRLSAGVPQTPPSAPLEITRVDLFALKGWNSRQVSVSGFMLGMSRTEVFRALQPQPMRLEDHTGQGCLKEKACDALTEGKYIGLSLLFDEDSDSVEKITIETPSLEVPREDRSDWLMNRFRGETLQFFDLYSNNLVTEHRNRLHRLFGAADSYWVGRKRDKSRAKLLQDRLGYTKPPVLATRGYQYRRLGLVVHLEYVGTDSLVRQPSELVKVSVDFVPPRVK